MSRPVVLFAGGGSGGHIFPNVAIFEQLAVLGCAVEGHFLISVRPLDRQVLEVHRLNHSVLAVQPLPQRLWGWPGWLLAMRRSLRSVCELIDQVSVAMVVATGGFVSAPVVAAARRASVPVALVNLDAVPGWANRTLARKATHVFSAYDIAAWPKATKIGVPLRKSAMGRGDPAAARRQLGLDPQRQTLLVCGGSQGASSINHLMIRLAEQGVPDPWQVLHLSGPGQQSRLAQVYAAAGITCVVIAFCDQMGLAWDSADLAISRSGAGSVAEVQANAVPTLFLPYPHHRDQHQRHNAMPLVRRGGAVLVEDQVSPDANVAQVRPQLLELMADHAERARMVQALRGEQVENGAEVVARWVAGELENCGEAGRSV